MPRPWLTPLLLLGQSLALGCGDAGSPAPTAPTARPEQADAASPAARRPGEPLYGLTADQRALFERGRLVFDRTFDQATGLGPLFNATSCGECHEDPASGGNGDEVETQVAAVLSDGTCDPFTSSGGPVIQQHATQLLQDSPLHLTSEPIPPTAPVAHRVSPNIFGFGLLDAVPDETILALADPEDRDGDGISGRPNRTPDGRIGRFSRKAATATLLEFNAGAFRNELGVTNPLFPIEGTVGPWPIPPGVDPVLDPEIDQDALSAADAFVRFLAPPAPLVLTKQARDGQEIFSRIQCTGCHVPRLTTGESPIPAMRHRQVTAYTDLLLHDMGPAMADICMQLASPSEFRTQPLMGLRLQPRFLHDGRAETVEQAIEDHGGEAARARDGFLGLPEAERAALVAFLKSL